MAMRKKLRPDYSRPVNWLIEYEEGPASDGWAYKFQQQPSDDGDWHDFSNHEQSCYRIVRPRMQFISAPTRVTNSVWKVIIESFRAIEPLLDAGVEELRIRAEGRKYWMWSIWLPEQHAVRFELLTRDGLQDALEQVNERVVQRSQAATSKSATRRGR